MIERSYTIRKILFHVDHIEGETNDILEVPAKKVDGKWCHFVGIDGRMIGCDEKDILIIEDKEVDYYVEREDD